MQPTYTKDQLNNMNTEYQTILENLRINDITEKIKSKVLHAARTSLIHSYQWFPSDPGAETLGLPASVPSKRILVEVCKKLQIIFVDSDIRIIDNSIYINWY